MHKAKASLKRSRQREKRAASTSEEDEPPTGHKHAADVEDGEERNPFEAMHFPPARKFGSGIYQEGEDAAGAGKGKGLNPQLFQSVCLDDAKAGRLEVEAEEVVGKLLYNFRDLKEATTGRSRLRIRPNRVFRTGCISRGDVNIDEIAKIIAFLKDTVGIRTIIDFRNKDEKQSDPFDQVLEELYPTTKDTGPNLDGNRRRFHIPLMNLDFKLRGLFNLGTNKMTKLKLLGAALPVANVTPTEVMSKNAMNGMGLLGLNQLMLVYSGKEIAQVLRLCTDPTNYPIMYHCSSGKDRTGLITALILRCCEADTKDIVNNYHESEIALAPVMDRIIEEDRAKGLDSGFDGTPALVMHETLKFIKANWGYTSDYLESIGFPIEWQHQLRDNLTKPFRGEGDHDHGVGGNSGGGGGYSKKDFEDEQAAAFQKFLWESVVPGDDQGKDDGQTGDTSSCPHIALGLKAKRLAPAIAKKKIQALERKEKKAKRKLKDWKKQSKDSVGGRSRSRRNSLSTRAESELGDVERRRKRRGGDASSSGNTDTDDDDPKSRLSRSDSRLARRKLRREQKKEEKKEKKKEKEKEKEKRRRSLSRNSALSESTSSLDSASERSLSSGSSSSSLDLSSSSSASSSDLDHRPPPRLPTIQVTGGRTNKKDNDNEDEDASPPPSPWARRRRSPRNAGALTPNERSGGGQRSSGGGGSGAEQSRSPSPSPRVRRRATSHLPSSAGARGKGNDHSDDDDDDVVSRTTGSGGGGGKARASTFSTTTARSPRSPRSSPRARPTEAQHEREWHNDHKNDNGGARPTTRDGGGEDDEDATWRRGERYQAWREERQGHRDGREERQGRVPDGRPNAREDASPRHHHHRPPAALLETLGDEVRVTQKNQACVVQ